MSKFSFGLASKVGLFFCLFHLFLFVCFALYLYRTQPYGTVKNIQGAAVFACTLMALDCLKHMWGGEGGFQLPLMNIRLSTPDDRLLFHALQFCFNRNSVCCLAEWLCLLPVGKTISFMDQKHFHMHIKALLGYSKCLRFTGEEQCFMHQEKNKFCHEKL